MYLFCLVRIPFQTRANLKLYQSALSFVQLSFGKFKDRNCIISLDWLFQSFTSQCDFYFFFSRYIQPFPGSMQDLFQSSSTYICCTGKGGGAHKSGYNALDVSLLLLNREKQLLCSTCMLKPSNSVDIHH